MDFQYWQCILEHGFNISNQVQSLSSISQVCTEYLYFFFKIVIISFVFNHCITFIYFGAVMH